jgi:maltose alpha-D-glucosyltransferase / alpha-amylase
MPPSPLTPPGPAWLRDAVLYQIYPQSFCDSNGDGIGDLAGITAKLDYIRSLGVDGIWLNPIFPSPFRDAGYDVSDFKDVASRYGTRQDLARLIAEAHARGLRVFLDIVAGHTALEHPWFVASCREETNRHTDYYIWAPRTVESEPGSLSLVRGYSAKPASFVANYYYCQPALNYGFARPTAPWQQPVDAPGPRAVRAELEGIMRHWLEQGVDGFRVDMASSLVKCDPDFRATRALWREFRAMFDRDYPEAILFSEWSSPEDALGAGFHLDFMIHINVQVYRTLFFHDESQPPFFSRHGEGSPSIFFAEFMRHYELTRHLGYISVPTGNHDIARPNDRRNRAELDVLMAFIFTLPGVPTLYYGDEIGLRYLPDIPSVEGGHERTGSRTPMQWSRAPNAGFSTANAANLYAPIDPDPDRPCVADQEGDPGSLLHHVRSLIRLRKRHRALGGEGGVHLCFARPDEYPLVYARFHGDECFLICINPRGTAAACTFHPPAGRADFKHAAGGAVVLTRTGHHFELSMPGISWAIYRAGPERP